jgi:predicted amidohydrolase YtcJ
LVVLSQHLFKINPMNIYKTRELMTVFGGRLIFRSGK